MTTATWSWPTSRRFLSLIDVCPLWSAAVAPAELASVRPPADASPTPRFVSRVKTCPKTQHSDAGNGSSPHRSPRHFRNVGQPIARWGVGGGGRHLPHAKIRFARQNLPENATF